MRIIYVLVLALLVLSSSSCIQLEGSTVPSRYFVLELMDSSTNFISEKNLTIIIDLADFPEYLKRPQVVAQRQKNMIHFSNSQRWASPLEDQVLHLLTNNLELLLPRATIRISPWHSKHHGDRNLHLSVKKLSGILGQQSHIDIRWQIVGKDGEKRSGQFLDQRSIDNSYEGLVVALNHGLEMLSKKLALELAEPEQN